jgi:hypothetical protein
MLDLQIASEEDKNSGVDDEDRKSFDDASDGDGEAKYKCKNGGHPLTLLTESPYIIKGKMMSVDCDICKASNIQKNEFLHCNTCS